MMKEMMYSLPATQVWAGLKGAEDKAAKLDAALKAMEQTMTLFYHHKGLSDEAVTALEYPLHENVCRRVYVCGRQPYRN